jgi:hypothetical protein
MEVACSKCGAKGRVPDQRLQSGPVSLRCSACRSVLRVGNPKLNPNGPAWFFDAGQGAQGPYRIDELIDLWQSGRLSWDARLWREGDPEWAVARAHYPFIDAIFAHDAGAPARAGALSAARRDANAVGQQERADARFAPAVVISESVADSANGERTDPQLNPPRHVPEASSDSSITEPRNPDVQERDRTAHDSLAPFERASRAPGRRWPAAILIGSSAIAACALFWSVRALLTSPAPTSTSAATTVQVPAATATRSELAREHMDVEAAVATGTQQPPTAAQTDTAVPIAEAKAAASPPAEAQAGTLSAAQARPLRSSARERGPGGFAAEPTSGDLPAGEREAPADAPDPEPDPAAASDAVPRDPAAASSEARAPDFLTAAAPLPDTPTTLQIASAMRAVAPAVRACGDAIAPTTVYVSIAITGATGRVARVSVPSSPSSLEQCVAAAVQNAAFPRFDRPQLELRFPFLLGH